MCATRNLSSAFKRKLNVSLLIVLICEVKSNFFMKSRLISEKLFREEGMQASPRFHAYRELSAYFLILAGFGAVLFVWVKKNLMFQIFLTPFFLTPFSIVHPVLIYVWLFFPSPGLAFCGFSPSRRTPQQQPGAGWYMFPTQPIFARLPRQVRK